MKKKIGILTFHFPNHNYGALLQTYASVVILRKRGFDPMVINLIPNEYSRRETSLIGRLLFLNPFENFRRKFIPLTNEIKSEEDLTNLNNKFDIFYVGSDQVWRREFTFENFYHYFLDFANDDKLKISYAASFGNDKIELDVETKMNINVYLKKFNAISVREDSGVIICKNEFDVLATKVLDPTLLLTECDFEIIINSEHHKKLKNSYIAYYQLTHELGESELANQISKYLDLPIQNIYRKTISIGFRSITPYLSFSEWLLRIKNSDFVVTDSYHCMIFAILYRKSFVVLGNEFGGSSRVISLLESLNLRERYLEEVDENLIAKLSPIDYNIVYEKLENLKSLSMCFLSSCKI